MPYTYTRAATSFVTGEGAPSAEAVKQGSAVLNDETTLRLTLLPSQAVGSVILNLETNPPTLELDAARCRIVPGYKTEDGAFHVLQAVGSTMHTVSGSYVGAGSELSIK